jgi:hypothetical protein
MCHALAMVTRSGEAAREETARFLRACFHEIRPVQGCFVWDGWRSAIATLGLADLKDIVKQAFERESVDPGWLHFEDFEKDLTFAVEYPDLPPRAIGENYTLIGDPVAEFSTWYGFSAKRQQDERRRERADVRLETDGRPGPHHFKKTGRNDPCPCGSGKKFKRCCLDRDRDTTVEPIKSVLESQ